MEFKKVKVNGTEYPIKFAQSVIGRLLRKNGIKLKDFNEEAMQDIGILYEFVYMAVAYASRRTDFKFDLTIEQFSDHLDDDPDALERCIEAYTDSIDTKDEAEVEAEVENEEGGKS